MTTHITVLQDEYLRNLAEGPMTTREIAMVQCVTVSTTRKMLDVLQKKDLVESTRSYKTWHGNTLEHRLTAPYTELDIEIDPIMASRSPKCAVSGEEIENIAMLRNKGLVGQRLIEAHRINYPRRSASTILKTLVLRAKQRGLCR